MQAGPEILITAMAARPGALDKAKMVGSSFVKIPKVLELLLKERRQNEVTIFVSRHDCLSTDRRRRFLWGKYAEGN